MPFRDRISPNDMGAILACFPGGSRPTQPQDRPPQPALSQAKVGFEPDLLRRGRSHPGSGMTGMHGTDGPVLSQASMLTPIRRAVPMAGN